MSPLIESAGTDRSHLMWICQLELRNFRGIKSGIIALPQHVVFLGANNAGKSTVVEALALLFGRERMVSPTSDWDFFGGSPRPDSRFYIIATLTGFSSDDPTAVPDWFIGENAAQPLWWHGEAQTLSTEADPPRDTALAARVALAGRFDEESCEFETIRYFYHGEADANVVSEVRNNWHESIHRFTADCVQGYLDWIRDWSLTPTGMGTCTQVQR